MSGSWAVLPNRIGCAEGEKDCEKCNPKPNPGHEARTVRGVTLTLTLTLTLPYPYP